MFAQDETMKDANPPYHQIPDYPTSYTPASVAARMVDGLGYRYYWATYELREEDLAYKPSEDSRTVAETLDHILGLTYVLVNATLKKPNGGGGERPEMIWQEKRLKTLDNIHKASNILKDSNEGEIEEYEIIFQRGDSSREFPFWNMLNGPLADAIYHTGQVVSHRRASGNPLHPGVSVFNGKTKETKGTK